MIGQRSTKQNCVKCAAHPLEPCVYDGRHVSVCAHCGGVWCVPDPSEQEKLGSILSDTAREPVGQLFESPKHSCVQCRTPLALVTVPEVEGLSLEVCRSCGGTWFDKGEWQYLQALRSWQGQLPGLDRETTWSEWCFQMFLRLPIEFNIKPRGLPWVTILIILICTAINLLMLDPNFSDRMSAYMVDGRASLRIDGLYTLITYQFLHDGFLHLLPNMYLLYAVGDNVEDVLGHWWYLLFYLACGVIAAITQELVAARFGESLPLLGASGSIAGVIAAYLLLFRRSQLTFMWFFSQYKLPASVWITVWLLVQVLAAWLDPSGENTGVALWAHIGGFVAGLVLILPFRNRLIAGHTLLYLLDRRKLHRSIERIVVPEPNIVAGESEPRV